MKVFRKCFLVDLAKFYLQTRLEMNLLRPHVDLSKITEVVCPSLSQLN